VVRFSVPWSTRLLQSLGTRWAVPRLVKVRRVVTRSRPEPLMVCGRYSSQASSVKSYNYLRTTTGCLLVGRQSVYLVVGYRPHTSDDSKLIPSEINWASLVAAFTPCDVGVSLPGDLFLQQRTL